MHQSRRLIIIPFIVIALFAIAFAHAVCAQGAKMLRVGRVGVQPAAMLPTSAFLERMEELGYVQGKNFVFESVLASGFADYDRAFSEVG